MSLHTTTTLTVDHTSPAGHLVARLDEVHAGYGPSSVLTGASLDLAQGEQVVLFGSPGTGRSTILRVLAEQLAPTSGSVTFPRERPRVAVAGQAPLLFDWLTLAENLELGRRFRDDQAGVDRADEALAVFGLMEHLPHRQAHLTPEQAVHASVARALSTLPDLLLLDHPFRGLGPSARERAGTWLRHLLVEDGLTSVTVTDDLHEALALADRVLVVGRGGRVLTTLFPTHDRTRELHRV